MSQRRSSRRSLRRSSRRRSSRRRSSKPGFRRLRKTPLRTIPGLRKSLKNEPVFWTSTGKRPSFRSRRSFIADLSRKSKRSKQVTRGPNKGKFRIDKGNDMFIVPWAGSSPRSKLGKRGYGWL